jgi:threonine dehydrogenase-like Zn-dependent dehydrogenase
MQALVYEGPRQLAMREYAKPKPSKNEALVQIERVGICGSDLHAYLGHDERRPAPLILGHEPAGVIASGPRAGERVAINPLVTCRQCRDCLDGRQNLCSQREIISMPPREGAFAQFVAMPVDNLVTLPDALAMNEAVIAEPMAVSHHAVRLGARALHRPIATASVVIIGGGAIGLGAALVLRQWGVQRIIVLEANRQRAEVLHNEPDLEVLDPADLSIPSTGIAELVVDAVGSEVTRSTACRVARAGGVIMHVGLQTPTDGIDARRLTLQEITLIGCYTYTAVDFMEVIDGLAQGRFGALAWIEERALAEGPQAFAEIAAGTCAAPKIILNPQ